MKNLLIFSLLTSSMGFGQKSNPVSKICVCIDTPYLNCIEFNRLDTIIIFRNDTVFYKVKPIDFKGSLKIETIHKMTEKVLSSNYYCSRGKAVKKFKDLVDLEKDPLGLTFKRVHYYCYKSEQCLKHKVK